MTGLKNCPACGAIIDGDDTECKICGISLEGEPSVRAIKDLPPAPVDSSVSIPKQPMPPVPRPSNQPPPPPSAKGTALPRPSQPPLAVPKEQVQVIPRPSSPPPQGREVDSTMKVPFSGRQKSGATPGNKPKASLPRPSKPPAPPQNVNKTMLMMPAMKMPTSDDDKKVQLPRPSAPPPPPQKEASSVKLPTPSQPPPPEAKLNQTLLGVPAQTLLSNEAKEEASNSRTTEPPTESQVQVESLHDIPEPKPLPRPKPVATPTPGIPEDTKVPSGKSNRLLIIGASIGAAVIAAVLIILFSGEKQEPENAVSAKKVASETAVDDEAAVQKAAAEKEAAEIEAAEIEAASETDTSAEETPKAELALLGESEATCKSFKDYPKFPYKNHLTDLQAKLGVQGVCSLFGNLNAAGIKAGFSDLPTAGPFDDDLRKGVTRVMVYPGKSVHKDASSIEFLFTDDTLYEIRFNYTGSYPGKLRSKAFKKTLGSAGRTKKDRLGRWYSTYKDGDMTVTQLEKKIKKNKYKWVVFSEPKTLKKIESAKNRKTRKAEKAYAEGMKLVLQRKFNKALKKFRESRRDRSDFATAHLAEALLLVRNEKFKLAKKAAENAIEKGRDQYAASQAHNLLAIAALYDGDKASAIDHLRKAEALDPSNNEYSTSIQELETGEYSQQRVAITAARISCIGTADAKRWTKKGQSARGNFESFKDYKKALKTASKKPAFKKAKRNRQRAECR